MRAKDVDGRDVLSGGRFVQAKISENAINEASLGEVNGAVRLILDFDAKIASVVGFFAKIKTMTTKFSNEGGELRLVIGSEDAIVNVVDEDKIFAVVQAGVDAALGHAHLVNKAGA